MLQQVKNLQAERDAIAAELAAIRADLMEVGTSAAEYMYDEDTWAMLEGFIIAIKKMRALEKNAKTKNDFANLRELQKRVDEAVESFYKSMKID